MLPAKWKISERSVFKVIARKKIAKEINHAWQKKMVEQGGDLPPNMTWNKFQIHPSVQRLIKQYMGEQYVQGTKTDWNKRNFVRFVYEPLIKKNVNKIADMIQKSPASFSEGKLHAEIGKQALRPVLIPPISMGISLLLICLTLAKLPFKYIELTKPENNALQPMSSKARMLKIVGVPALVILLPLLLVSNIYTSEKHSTVNFFLNKVQQSTNPLFAYAFKWTLHTQPLLQPMGQKFEQYTRLYEQLSPLTRNLHSIDLSFGTAIPAKVDKAVKPTLASKRKVLIKRQSRSDETALLWVSTNRVMSHSVRIFNLERRYFHGMPIKPGNYEIEVTSQNGFTPHRQWYSIKEGDNKIRVSLVSKPRAYAKGNTFSAATVSGVVGELFRL